MSLENCKYIVCFLGGLLLTIFSIWSYFWMFTEGIYLTDGREQMMWFFLTFMVFPLGMGIACMILAFTGWD